MRLAVLIAVVALAVGAIIVLGGGDPPPQQDVTPAYDADHLELDGELATYDAQDHRCHDGPHAVVASAGAAGLPAAALHASTSAGRIDSASTRAEVVGSSRMHS